MSSINILVSGSDTINYVSYLNQQDTSNFINTTITPSYFGSMGYNRDVIEVGIFDASQSLLVYSSVTGSYTTKNINYFYVDVDGNSFVDYYEKSSGNFITDSNSDILIDFPALLSASIYTSSSVSASLSRSGYNLYTSLTPVINFFSTNQPLMISDISNSTKEIKLVKNFPNESVDNTTTLSFSGNQILIGGKTSISLKSGIVQTLKVSNGDISSIGFSVVKDGPILGTGVEYKTGILYKNSTGEIIIDTTQGFPNSIWVYNKNASGFGCQIFLSTEVDSDVFRLNTEFLSLDSSKFVYNQIYSSMEYLLNSFNILSLYQLTVGDNAQTISNLKSYFGLSTDSDVYNLLTTIYYGEAYYDPIVKKQITVTGIKDYILNYMKFNYNLIGDFDSLQKQINRINIYSVKSTLSRRNPNIPGSINSYISYQSSLAYLSNFFNSYLMSCLYNTQNSFVETLKQPLRNALNFGSGSYQLILNSYIDYTDPDNLVYVVKLKDELPTQYSVGDTCSVSNITFIPFYQLINYELIKNSLSIKLSGPNFSVYGQNLQPGLTRSTPFYNSGELSITDTIEQQISVTRTSTQFNIDFNDFTNFIVFSSALLRIKIFENKIIKLTLLNTSTTSAYSGSSPSSFTQNDGFNNIISLDFYNDVKSKNNQITDIIKSFDPYESYLYNQFVNRNITYDVVNKIFVSGSSPAAYVNDIESSAYEYDKKNRDSLVNNTPEYIVENTQNDEYLKFLSMIGHHFDNIYLYISNMNVYTQIGNDINNGIPRNLISAVLDSFGMNLPPTLSGTIDDESVMSTYLTGSNNHISLDDKTKIVWKRILSNLPAIYKSKGTIESIKYILACYGVPENLVVLKEFGGGYVSPVESSLRNVSTSEYLLQFVGNVDEYVQINQNSTCKSVDFKFSINSENYSDSDIVELYMKRDSVCAQNMSFGVIKLSSYGGNDTYGSFYIVLTDGTDLFSFVTPQMDIFDGNVNCVMLRKNYPSERFVDSNSSNPQIPVQYDILLAKNGSINDINSIKKYSFILSGSMNEIFDSNIVSVFGNSSASVIESDNSNILPFISEDLVEMFKLENYQSESGYWINSLSNIFSGLNQKKFIGSMDKFILSNIPVDDLDFYTRCINLDSYSDGDSQFNNLNTLFKFNLGYPTDISISSSFPEGYTVYNSNNTYSQITASVYNFLGNNISQSLNTVTCISESASTFPYQTKVFGVINQYNTSEVGPNRFEDDKIHRDSLILNGTKLSPITSICGKSSGTHNLDSRKFGIFVSPIQERDDDILNFIGNDEIVSTLADPRNKNTYDNKYDSLIELRGQYYGYNIRPRILFNELFMMYQIYIDKSIFQTLLNVLPGRNKVYSGILIEPTILERNKIPNKASSFSQTILSGAIDSFTNINSKVIPSINTSISSIPIDRNFTSYSDNNWNGFNEFGDVPDEFQLGTVCNYGTGFVYKNGEVFKAYIVDEIKTIYPSSGNGVVSKLSIKSEKMSVLPITESTIPTNYRLFTTGQYYNNLANKPRFNKKVSYYSSSDGNPPQLSNSPSWNVSSRQTNKTTINSIGMTNSSPIIMTIVGGSISAGNVINTN